MGIVKSKNKGSNLKSNYNELNIKYDFSFFKFKSFKDKEFTNFVKDYKEKNKILNKFFNQLPRDNETLEKNKHCHYIFNEEYVKVSKILNKNFNIGKHISLEEIEFYQIALTNGLRIICIKISHIVYPLFLDPHHLIYPSEKHNQKDTKKYKICIFS